MFRLDTTSHILISDYLKQQLDEAGVRNVTFESVITQTKPKQVDASDGDKHPV
jgi:hypothetical protein